MSRERLTEFKVMCERHDLEVPEIVTQSLDLIDTVQLFAATPERKVLDMSADEAREYVTEISIRDHVTKTDLYRGLDSGVVKFKDQIWAEIRENIRPDLDRIVTELQPRFAEAAAPIIEGATRHGFTYATTSDQLVRAGDLNAVELWRTVGQSWAAIRPLARWRARLSELFEVSPTTQEALRFGDHRGGVGNWSVCFAAGESWSLTSGYHIEDTPSLAGLDWFALAAGGGLRLNTPSEVREKLVKRARKQQIQLVDQTQLDDPSSQPSYAPAVGSLQRFPSIKGH